MGGWPWKGYCRVCSVTEDRRVAWIVRLVEAEAGGDERCADVMTIDRPDDLTEIANLGLTLAEAKRLMAGLQQQIVAAQARSHAVRRPDCRSCGGVCRVKDYRTRGCNAVRSGHGAASAILLCQVWRNRTWYRMAVAVSVNAG